MRIYGVGDDPVPARLGGPDQGGDVRSKVLVSMIFIAYISSLIFTQ